MTGLMTNGKPNELCTPFVVNNLFFMNGDAAASPSLLQSAMKLNYLFLLSARDWDFSPSRR